ncbi:hypothetical protein ACFQHO_53975 [Actinomadura yumaensis]|uniref:hypothetical protein n=1 Tax=Actinomadura yumaensis TaxID=111807 RepID=UPI00361A9F6A
MRLGSGLLVTTLDQYARLRDEDRATAAAALLALPAARAAPPELLAEARAELAGKPTPGR